MFFTSHLYLAARRSLSSANETLGLPSWKTYKTISFLASNLFTLIFLGLIVMVINQMIQLLFSNIIFYQPLFKPHFPDPLSIKFNFFSYLLFNTIERTIFIQFKMIHNEARIANVVLDVGSYHTFAGQAGMQNPRFASNSYLVEYYHKKDKYAAGKEALDGTSIPKDIHSVFENVTREGKVDKFHFNIDKFDKFVETILMDNLELDNCSISLLIAEDMSVELDPSQVLKQRQKIVDYLLQSMQLSNIAFVKKPILSTFALGRSSSVVLDSGHSFSHCTVVEDGYCAFNKTLRFGGSILHNIVQQQIERKNHGRPFKIHMQTTSQPYRQGDIIFHRIAELENIINKFPYTPIKSTMPSEDSEIIYTLPDGHNIKLKRSEIIDPFTNYQKFWQKHFKNGNQDHPFYIDSSFFKIVDSYRGLEKFVFDTIDEYFTILDQKNRTIIPPPQSHSDPTRKKQNQIDEEDLLNNVILMGGNLYFGDVAWKISQGVQKRGGKVLQSPLPFNRDLNGNQCSNTNSLSWIGGSIVCNLEVFNHFWIKLAEWRELGSHLISAKSLSPADMVKNHLNELDDYVRNDKKLELVSKKCA